MPFASRHSMMAEEQGAQQELEQNSVFAVGSLNFQHSHEVF